MAIIIKGNFKPITTGRFKVRNRFLTGLPDQAKVAEAITYVGSERRAWSRNSTSQLTGTSLDARANLNNTETSLLGVLPNPPTTANQIITSRILFSNPTTVEWAYNFDQPYTGRVIVDFGLTFSYSSYASSWPQYGGYTFQVYSGTSTLSGSSLTTDGPVIASHYRSTASMVPAVTVPTDVVFDVNVENCTGLYFRISDNVTFHRSSDASVRSSHRLSIRSIQLPDFPL